MPTIRTKFIDFDSRREPKTKHYCVACQKDLKGLHRFVYVGEGMEAIHPDDVSSYLSDPTRSSIGIGPFPIGMDCAKRLGLEWSIKEMPNAK